MRYPARFGCARVSAWVGEDALLPWFGGGPELLVAQPASHPKSHSVSQPAAATGGAEVRYCDVARVRVQQLFR